MLAAGRLCLAAWLAPKRLDMKYEDEDGEDDNDDDDDDVDLLFCPS